MVVKSNQNRLIIVLFRMIFLFVLTHFYRNQWLTASALWLWRSLSPVIMLLFLVSLPLPLCCVVVVVVFGRVIPVMAGPMFRMILPLMAQAGSVGRMLFSWGGHNTEKEKNELGEETATCNIASPVPGSVVMATTLCAVMIRQPCLRPWWTWHPSDRPLLVLDKR